MAEFSENLFGIKKMPLFPLPLVLLPYEILPLHIFEPRYRQMFKDIAFEQNLFGVSLFEPKDSSSEKPEIGSIGCVAEVRETQTLEDGRSNILTMGLTRYQIIEYLQTSEPYFVADVEFFEDEIEDEAVLKPLADKTFTLFERIAQAAYKLSNQRGELPKIPQAPPEQLSFLVAAAFNLDNELKYRFLKMRSTSLRLQKLIEILNQAVDKLEDNAEISQVAQTNGHSKKKIDF